MKKNKLRFLILSQTEKEHAIYEIIEIMMDMDLDEFNLFYNSFIEMDW